MHEIRESGYKAMHYTVHTAKSHKRNIPPSLKALAVRVHQNTQPHYNPDKWLLLIERHTIKGRRTGEHSHSADCSDTGRVHKVNHRSQYGVGPHPGTGRSPVTDRGTE